MGTNYGSGLGSSNPKATNYGSGLVSRKGKLTIDDVPIDAWSGKQIETAYSALQNYQGHRNSNYYAELGKVKPLYDASAAQSRYEELLGAMNESFSAMAAAAQKTEPAVEPLKQAQQQYTAAQTETARKQQLRSGLLSFFTRYGAGGNARSTAKKTLLGGA